MPPGPPAADAAAAPRRRGGLWLRVALAAALLATSAAARGWQARRVDQVLRDGRACPFDLAALPRQLGPWVGADRELDPNIARATGSTDRVFREYQHAITGQKIGLILLFGPSTEMYVHTPENCYPASGYELAEGPIPRRVAAGDASWPFHELVYAKGDLGQAERREVYYTWRYAGAWTPGLTSPKGFERIPGMFKVHIDRAIRPSEMELRDVGSPSRDFLERLMPELDARIAAGTARRATPPRDAPPAPAPAPAPAAPRTSPR